MTDLTNKNTGHSVKFAFQMKNNNNKFLVIIGASLVAQLVKSPPVMRETPILLLGQEDPLEKR